MTMMDGASREVKERGFKRTKETHPACYQATKNSHSKR